MAPAPAPVRLSVVTVGLLLAAKLPAEPFYVLAAMTAVLAITPVVIGFLGQLRGLSIEEIRDEMTYATLAALPVAVLVGVALIIYLIGTR